MNELIPAPEGAAERFSPPISEASGPFWEATRDRRLVLQWCTDCERPVHFPREACPGCLGTALEFRPAAGVGVLHAVTVQPKPANPTMSGRGTTVVVLVDLAEGARLLSNLLGPGAEEAEVDDEVVVAWEPLADGRHLPVFQLAPR